MPAPLWAGFEPALIHWNGHCVLQATDHLPGRGLARHYADAIAAGAVGFRDALPARFDVHERYAAIRAAAGALPVAFDMAHFDRPADPLGHARRVARQAGPHDLLCAVNEPSSEAMNAMGRDHAVALASAMMGAGLTVNPDARWLVCDPAHDTSGHTFAATNALVAAFGPHIDLIGLNSHGCCLAAPLRDVIRAAADRYPDHQIALTEHSWHDGHPDARVPGVSSRHDWLRYVDDEIAASGVPVAFACYAPWLDMAFEPGQVWPNGWPRAA